MACNRLLWIVIVEYGVSPHALLRVHVVHVRVHCKLVAAQARRKASTTWLYANEASRCCTCLCHSEHFRPMLFSA